LEENSNYEKFKKIIDPKKTADREWYLALLDGDEQKRYEDEHIDATMRVMRISKIVPLKKKIAECEKKKKELSAPRDYSADRYAESVNLDGEIARLKEKVDSFRHFFEEPYFARMDVIDNKEGYNSYYIGKRGEEGLEIVDWRAPLAKKYYQKSRISFTINEYDYKTVLRRSLRTHNGKVLDFKNEYLSVKDYLSREEIGGRDEEIIFDPYLRQLIKARKDEENIKDIIETIQEKQFEIITLPDRTDFIVQGCAGSGKTMIMLHRLSYLMYNNENLKSRDVLVITPSNSFNDFIDELAAVLELEKVKTTTLADYFSTVLLSLGVDAAARFNPDIVENEQYDKYIYSEKFITDSQKTLNKIFDSVYGLLSAFEGDELLQEIVSSFKKQQENYRRIKNASVRVRRAVLGEIKEKPEGGLYYTKPFREFMNAISEAEEFLTVTIHSPKSVNQSYFYKKLVEFYKSSAIIAHGGNRVVAEAVNSLSTLAEAVKKEIFDLKRYKLRIGKTETYTYIERITAREQLIKEIEKITACTQEIGAGLSAFSDFYSVVKGEKNFSALGKCETRLDLIKFLYKNTVKKNKLKYGVTGRGLIKSDPYAICMILALTGENMPAHYSRVFVDEGQDISVNEYKLLKMINKNASFNIFGDLKQNITPLRGLSDWSQAFSFPVYTLNQNYRNTNQIVDYVARSVDVDMQAIGFDGPEITNVLQRGVGAYFSDKTGLKAIIASSAHVEEYAKSTYNIVSRTGKIAKKKINLLSVYESKGLEFAAVAVDERDMSVNEKYIACTRALMHLGIITVKEKRK